MAGEAKRTRRKQVERSDQAISALREAALDLLVEGGVSRINLGEVGDRAGYSRGIVHYHFGTREALLSRLLEDLLASGLAIFDSGSSPRLGGIAQIIAAVEEMAANHPKETFARILLLCEAATTESIKLRGQAAKYNATIRKAIASRIDADPASKLLQTTPEQMAVLILSTLRGIHLQWLAERETFDLTDALRNMKRLFTPFEITENED